VAPVEDAIDDSDRRQQLLLPAIIASQRSPYLRHVCVCPEAKFRSNCSTRLMSLNSVHGPLMPIFRYADPLGDIHHGLLHADGSRERLEGDLFSGQRPSGEVARVARLLAPLEPRALLCIGLN